jgi:hypothetical protein
MMHRADTKKKKNLFFPEKNRKDTAIIFCILCQGMDAILKASAKKTFEALSVSQVRSLTFKLKTLVANPTTFEFTTTTEALKQAT